MNLDFKLWSHSVKVLRAGLLRYEKSISDDPAFLISKVQLCPTSSVTITSVLHHMIDKDAWLFCIAKLMERGYVGYFILLTGVDYTLAVDCSCRWGWHASMHSALFRSTLCPHDSTAEFRCGGHPQRRVSPSSTWYSLWKVCSYIKLNSNWAIW